MSTVCNINKWARGTNPPIRVELLDENTGEPISLVGCVIVIVIRDEKWENSKNDDTAAVKRRIECYEVLTPQELTKITTPRVHDLCWIADTGQAMSYDGSTWVPALTSENLILEGMVTFRFTREEMLLEVKDYYYSIDIQFPSGEVAKIVKGKIKITDNTVNSI